MSLTASSPHDPLLQAPLAYRIGLALIRRRWRGSSLLFDRLVRPGLAQQVVRYRLSPSLHIDTPLFTDNLWDEELLLGYEQAFVDQGHHSGGCEPPRRRTDVDDLSCAEPGISGILDDDVPQRHEDSDAPDVRSCSVQKGIKVEFPNLDDAYHNVFSYSPAKRFDLGRYLPSERPIPAQVLDKPGMITLRCDIHEHMRAIILVLDTPHFSVTGTDGAFQLKNLPPGTFTLKAWVNSRVTQQKQVELKPGAPVTVNFP